MVEGDEARAGKAAAKHDQCLGASSQHLLALPPFPPPPPPPPLSLRSKGHGDKTYEDARGFYSASDMSA